VAGRQPTTGKVFAELKFAFLDDFRTVAEAYAALSEEQVAKLLENNDLMEMGDGDEEPIQERYFGSAALVRRHAAQGRRARQGDHARLRRAAPAAIEPAQIKRLREAIYVSQPVFARYLNTSESTVEKWETGAKRPSGMALELLMVVQKHGLQVLG